MQEKVWYLKNRSTTIGILTKNLDNGLYSMELTKPELFIGRVEKVWMPDKMVREFIERRLTPQYQGGYRELVESYGIDPDKPSHREELFFYTRGAKLGDHMWVADRDEDTYKDSPYWEVYLDGDE